MELRVWGRRAIGNIVAKSIVNARVSRAQIPLLTALRFFAALQVMMVHVMPFEIRTTTWYGSFFNAGNEAVIFFFVLSGFILTYVYSGASEQGTLVVSSMNFWLARLARLLPAYVIGLVLTLPSFLYAVLLIRHEPVEALLPGLLLVPLFLQSWYPPAASA